MKLIACGVGPMKAVFASPSFCQMHSNVPSMLNSLLRKSAGERLLITSWLSMFELNVTLALLSATTAGPKVKEVALPVVAVERVTADDDTIATMVVLAATFVPVTVMPTRSKVVEMERP